MARLRLNLLGVPEVCLDGAALAFATRKATALLCYLVAEPVVHAREHLATLFWPESDEERSRGALRSTLGILRQALRAAGQAELGFLVSERDRLGLAAGADCESDLQIVQAAFDLARRPALAPAPATLAQLAAAVDAYRGDFLAGFSLTDAPDFDDWCANQRALWHGRIGRVCDRLSRLLAEGGEGAGAADIAARWIALDPLDEVAHRRLMQLRFAAGDRTGALQAYEQCRALLAAQLGVAPAAEAAALAERVRRDAPPAPATRQPAVHAAEAPLIGRVGEHSALVAAFEAARAGRAGLVLDEGEPGIGKTRLVGDFLRWARAQGADILQGRAYEVGNLPYDPLIDALRARFAPLDQLRSLLAPTWLAELGRILPDLRDGHPDLPAASGESDEGRARLFEAVARLGQALARQGTVVLFCDDVQWADSATIDLLSYASRRWAAERAPILVIGALRPEELPATGALRDWLTGLERDRRLTRLPLSPLTAEETDRLGQALVGRPAGVPAGRAEVPAAFGQWLYRETGGHPLFTVETISSLVETGALDTDGDTWPVAPPSAATPAPGVQAVIRARVGRLGQEAQRLLLAGAVLGDNADFAALHRVADLDEETGLTALEALLGRQLLRESGTGYRFGHDKIREVVYADASAARRRALHGRALRVLAAARAAPAELARHAQAAGLNEQAFAHSVAAGDAAMRLFAVREALRHYEQAQSLLLALAPEDLPVATLYHLFNQLGRCYELTDQYPQARAAYDALLAAAQEQGDAAQECAALNGLATVAAHEVDFDAQAAYLRRALAVAERGDDPAAIIDTEWNLGRLTWFRGDFAAGRRHNERALALARSLNLREPIARGLNWTALINVVQGGWAETVARGTEARDLYRALGNRAMEADCVATVAAALLRLGQTEAGIAAAREGLAISRAIENRWGQADAAKELALGLLEQGDYAEALAVAAGGVAVARAANYPPLLSTNLAVLGAIHRRLGAAQTARSLHEEALAADEQGTAPAFTELVLGELTADCAALGDWAEAARHARRALALRDDGLLYGGITRWYETEALLRAGDATAATEDLARFERQIGANPRYRLPLLRAHAVLAAWRGASEEAIEHLREAAGLTASLNLPGERQGIASALGNAWRAQGDEERARLAVAEAAAILRALADRLPDEALRAAFLAAHRWDLAAAP